MTAALRICTACWASRADEAGAPCVECGARGFTGTLSLAPPVLPRCDDECTTCRGYGFYSPHPDAGDCADCGGTGKRAAHDDGCLCPECCDDNDAPTAAELHREDSESLDRELASFAWSQR